MYSWMINIIGKGNYYWIRSSILLDQVMGRVVNKGSSNIIGKDPQWGKNHHRPISVKAK